MIRRIPALTGEDGSLVSTNVFLDALLDRAGGAAVSGSGERVVPARPALIDGTTFRHALVTQVEREGDRSTASLTIRLESISGAPFGRFSAMVGRDDKLSADGPAYVYFEVWGDERPLYRSPALRSRRYTVPLGAGARNVRKGPEEVDVSVRGVRDLRLTVRYASDVPQNLPPTQMRGRGCVWGDPQLSAAENAPTGAPDAVLSPLRDTLRGMAAQIAAQAVVSATGDTPPRPLPLRVLIAPPQGGPHDSLPLAGETLREEMARLLTGARRGEDRVFLPVAEAKGTRRGVPADDATAREMARRAGAMLVLITRFTPPAARNDGWRAEMRLLSVPTGRSEGAAIGTIATGR